MNLANFKTFQEPIIFYEKPGCAGNARQKKLLEEHKIAFTTKSMLTAPWTKESLNSFFYGLDIVQIVNETAPKIKSGEINIYKISKDEMIELMLKDPILIKRPLIEVGNHKICGFNIERINELLQSDIDDTIKIATCTTSDKCEG